MLPLLRVRSAAAALQASLRAKLRQTVESAGSAAIPSQLMIMATASRGVKPNIRRLQGVIRQSFEDLFSRLVFVARRLLSPEISRALLVVRSFCAPAPLPSLCRATAPSPPSALFAHPRPCHRCVAQPRPRRRLLFLRIRAPAIVAVSYTHLTLPTILRV